MISTITGLDCTSGLRLLDLSSNRISSIEGLDSCQSLETLILNENLLENLQGLLNVGSLRILQVARNRISKIGSALNSLSELHELNISGNSIASFKEILALCALPSLRVLSFNDPHFLENSVCNLCNYQTFVLYQLPHLTQLDSFLLSDESKHYAEATFMKKKMYYNMRIKTIKMTASNLKKAVRDIAIEFEGRLFEGLKPIEIMLKATEREIHERTSGEKATDCYKYEVEESDTNPLDFEDFEFIVERLQSKAASLAACIHSEYSYLQYLDSIRHSLRNKIETMSRENIHKLVTELETGGNIRFEEGKPTDN